MKLPFANNAIVDINKLKNYCLSKEHPVGKHKALVFETTIGITSIDAENFRVFILGEIINANAELMSEDNFGTRFFVDLPYTTINKIVFIRTLWIILNNEKVPRLTSCYVKK